MKLNTKMSKLMQSLNSQWPLDKNVPIPESPRLESVKGSVLLKDQSDSNRHIRISDQPDRTAFECFVNHVHFPFTGTRESLLSRLGYIEALERALTPLSEGRTFRIIFSISDEKLDTTQDCTVRFHVVRPGEAWISDNLEGYESEAILVVDVGASPR